MKAAQFVGLSPRAAQTRKALAFNGMGFKDDQLTEALPAAYAALARAYDLTSSALHAPETCGERRNAALTWRADVESVVAALARIRDATPRAGPGG